ncbi:uncharacterized protein B0I36DRAFT_356792 [Microdochium trichocladiopsis]|uniref:Uncharacterized protein n=1 Tax=Microdochium trichocladiopsis TaxID=1682393 RepID=A0A9P8XQY8_9PEZI|nr:uncharacterized protein B0I36DRAFT_356792 [Microdochium trichocladiopsis]KAH7009068.1 hypothetical protein B0I36DRAFT_356792 [Microdochium trichocladiopsis]
MDFDEYAEDYLRYLHGLESDPELSIDLSGLERTAALSVRIIDRYLGNLEKGPQGDALEIEDYQLVYTSTFIAIKLIEEGQIRDHLVKFHQELSFVELDGLRSRWKTARDVKKDIVESLENETHAQSFMSLAIDDFLRAFDATKERKEHWLSAIADLIEFFVECLYDRPPCKDFIPDEKGAYQFHIGEARQASNSLSRACRSSSDRTVEQTNAAQSFDDMKPVGLILRDVSQKCVMDYWSALAMLWSRRRIDSAESTRRAKDKRFKKDVKDNLAYHRATFLKKVNSLQKRELLALLIQWEDFSEANNSEIGMVVRANAVDISIAVLNQCQKNDLAKLGVSLQQNAETDAEKIVKDYWPKELM